LKPYTVAKEWRSGHLFAMSLLFKVPNRKKALLSLFGKAGKLRQACGSEAAGGMHNFGMSEDVVPALKYGQSHTYVFNYLLRYPSTSHADGHSSHMVPAKEKDHQNVSMEVLPIKEQTLPNKPRQI